MAQAAGMTTTHTSTRKKNLGLIVAGALSGLFAAVLLAVGGLAFWGDGQKDADGYLSTSTERFATDTNAVASDNLDFDLDGAESFLREGGLGTLRLQVTPQNGEPVFVGVASTDDADDYLRGVAHSMVTDIDVDPFDAESSRHDGERRPAAPAQQDIWVESAIGSGSQTLTWDVDDGDWSVVVMNADGSPGVAADVRAGAEVPALNEVGVGATIAGSLLLAGGGLMLAFGIGLGGRRSARA